MKKARLIYNPTSGRETARRHLADILSSLEGAGYETSAFATSGEGDATREVARVADERFDLVVAAGGDGTVYEVINGLAGKRFRPNLGVLPLGTTNDFAQAIKMPKNFYKALGVLANGIARPVDVGKMNDRYFINIAGGGTLTELTYDVPIKLKTVLGKLAYYVKGIEMLPRFKPFWAEFETPEGRFSEEIMLFLVSNTNSVGGFKKLAPKAKFDDGLLDVLMMKKCSFAELARILTLVSMGHHVTDPNVIYFKTPSLSVKPLEPIQINLDGELGGMAPCEFEVLKGHLNVILPR